MGLFNTKKHHISTLEQNLSPLITEYIPEFENLLNNSTIYSIHFMAKNKGITLVRGYDTEFYKKVIGDDRIEASKIEGVFLKNRSTKNFEPIEIHLMNDSIQHILVNSADRFHKTYDLSSIKVENFKSEILPTEHYINEELMSILSNLSEDELNSLDINASIELEFNEIFYTVIDMEDGNFIGVNDKGEFYRLIHDHSEPVKLIFSNSEEFFNSYSGDKHTLEQYFV